MADCLQELRVPEHWRTLDFISDIHLDAGAPKTQAAWARFMADTPADALFILGDLFEVWVGDDVLQSQPSGFESQCVNLMRRSSERLSLFFMHGNRDFLAGTDLLKNCGATLLADPCTLILREQRWLLSHGDALCLDDEAYLAFRKQVRDPGWQETFLAKPLAERQAIARHVSQQSQQHQAQRWAQGDGYADVDEQAARQCLLDAQASTLIHGHTHRPAGHDLGQGLQRQVLSDWDAAARPPRAQVLRVSLLPAAAPRLQRLALS